MSAAEIVGRYVEVDGNRTFYDECGEGTPVEGSATACWTESSCGKSKM